MFHISEQIRHQQNELKIFTMGMGALTLFRRRTALCGGNDHITHTLQAAWPEQR